MQLSGAQILVQSLKAENVEYVFGYPGGAVLEIYDALFQLNKFRHILVRHEQAAVHAADAYARTSGKVGVALVTSGPGATNAITGIATAYTDSIPMVVISGQVGTPAIGSDAFQEIDMIGVSRPCVKHNFLVRDVRDIASTIKKAFYIASTGRPGPVVVDIPKDITAAKCKFEYPAEVHMRSYNPVVKGHQGQIKKAVQLLLGAKRPMIYTGGGVVLSNASEQLTKLTRLLGFPITNTLMGLGGYPATDSQFLGMPGMHGTVAAVGALQQAGADWWQIYQDPMLSQLMQQLNQENLSLQQAEARFRYANALLQQQRAARQPSLALNASANRSGGKNTASSGQFGSEIQASWMPDLWGRVAKAIEGQQVIELDHPGDRIGADHGDRLELIAVRLDAGDVADKKLHLVLVAHRAHLGDGRRRRAADRGGGADGPRLGGPSAGSPTWAGAARSVSSSPPTGTSGSLMSSIWMTRRGIRSYGPWTSPCRRRWSGCSRASRSGNDRFHPAAASDRQGRRRRFRLRPAGCQ